MSELRQMTETEKAYLAGMIDGEGCITITCNRGRYYVLTFILTGTHRAHIEQCASMAGLGKVYEVKRNPPQAWCYHWRSSANEAAAILKLCLPYLVYKADQAKLGIAFQREMSSSAGQNGPNRMPRAILNRRQWYMDKMKELKNGGKIYDDELIIIDPPRPAWQQASLIS